MDVSIGAVIASLRKEKGLMQKGLAAKLSEYGFSVAPKTIYNWEKELSQPSIPHFLALCDILDVDDVLWQFASLQKGPYAGLNRDGRRKAREFVDLLRHVNMYTTADDISSVDNILSFDKNYASSDKYNSVQNETPLGSGRILRLYDIPVSAGTGNFLDESGWEEIEAPSYVPVAVDFALRLTGDSMEPLLTDGQVIWVREQEVLESGEIGIFTYSDNVYCKKLIADGKKAFLRSLNPLYGDIEVKEDFGFRVLGKVVC